MPTRRSLLLLGAVVLAAVVVHGPALRFEFVLDDHHLIVRNRFVREDWSALRAFGHHFFHGAPGSPGYYRPLVVASFALNGRTTGWSPPGFHLVNVLLHGVNAALLFLLARRLGAREPAAALAAALFAVHPATAWPVASIAARVDLLAGTCLLLAWLALARARRREGGGWRGAVRPAGSVGGAFLAAMLSKESAVAFLVPLALGLRPPRDRGGPGDAGRRTAADGDRRGPAERRGPRPGAIAWAILGGIAALAAYAALRRAAGMGPTLPLERIDPPTNPVPFLPFPGRLLTALRVAGRHLVFLFAPLRFSDPRGYGPAEPAVTAADPWVAGTAVALLAWGAAVVVLWFRRHPSAALLGFSLASFLPASNLVAPIASLYSMNYLYLPLLGLCLALAAAFRSPPSAAAALSVPVAEPATAAATPAAATPAAATPAAVPAPAVAGSGPPWRRRLPAAGGAALFLLLGAKTVIEARPWRDDLALARDWTERFPRYAVGPAGLGAILLGQARNEEAIAPLRRALELDERSAAAHYNLGLALARVERDPAGLAEALRHTEIAIARSYDLVPAYVNAGKILLMLERYREAEVASREALRIAPGYPPARHNLGSALFRQDRYLEAASMFADLARDLPRDVSIRSHYVTSLLMADTLDEARSAALQARREFPDSGRIDYLLSRIEARAGRRGEALFYLRSAVAKDRGVIPWAEREADFAPLRGMAAFAEILQEGGR
jgi:tetratricopeptide (TPR) repeat protein